MENPAEYITNPQKFHELVSKKEMMAFALDKKKKSRKTRITITVEEIRGVCPIYKVGNKMVIDSDIHEELNLELSDRVCMSLIDNLHYRMTWARAKQDLYDHITVNTGECRTHCAHPGPPYTPCGGVIFQITREELSE